MRRVSGKKTPQDRWTSPAPIESTCCVDPAARRRDPAATHGHFSSELDKLPGVLLACVEHQPRSERRRLEKRSGTLRYASSSRKGRAEIGGCSLNVVSFSVSMLSGVGFVMCGLCAGVLEVCPFLRLCRHRPELCASFHSAAPHQASVSLHPYSMWLPVLLL